MMYDGLLPHAKQLAQSPPMDIYARMINLVDPNAPEIDKTARDNIDGAGTICDLTAYSLMLVAAGIERVEAMKDAVNKRQKYAKVYEGDARDRAYCFKNGRDDAANEFQRWMTAWSKLAGNGVVQLKFNPAAGAHTFAVERVTISDLRSNKDKDAPLVNRFRVYQSYEGTFRLLDFLGLAQNDDFVKSTLEHFYMKKLDQQPYVKGQISRTDLMKLREQNRAKNIASMVEQFKAMTKRIGRCRTLTWDELYLEVVLPCMKLLGGGMTREDYQQLAGVLAKENMQSAENLIVMMCDLVNYSEFEGNFKKVSSGAWLKSTTEYASIYD